MDQWRVGDYATKLSAIVQEKLAAGTAFKVTDAEFGPAIRESRISMSILKDAGVVNADDTVNVGLLRQEVAEHAAALGAVTRV